MTSRGVNVLKVVALVVAILVVVGIAAAMPLVGLPPLEQWLHRAPPNAAPPSPDEPLSSVRLAKELPDTLEFTDPEAVKKLGVQGAEVKKLTPARQLQPPHHDGDGWNAPLIQEVMQARQLQLIGTTALDRERLQGVKARFPGEVVEIANLEGASEAASPVPTVPRPVRYGDRVARGQLLAVVWSSDLGSKKSDLVDALSQLWLDEKALERQEDLYKQGGTPLSLVEAARQHVQSDRNHVAAAERTLRVWRVPEAEIQAVRDEAERILEQGGKRDPEKEKNWARVEVRAPFDGIIIEKNVTLHQIVDTSTDLFKVSDLRRLEVWANAYEEDLPALQALPAEQRRWQIRLEADPTFKPLAGTIDVIGPVIDPSQHTAVILGRVDNPEERLRAGQLVTATITLPPLPDELIVPTTALIEDGRESIVFIIPDANKPVYTQRHVTVTRRGQEVVFLRSRTEAAGAGERRGAAAERKQGPPPLRPGDRVVTNGALEMEARLEDLQSAKPKQ